MQGKGWLVPICLCRAEGQSPGKQGDRARTSDYLIHRVLIGSDLLSSSFVFIIVHDMLDERLVFRRTFYLPVQIIVLLLGFSFG